MIYRTLFQRYIVLASIFTLFSPAISLALTPVARWDVVPFQRIEFGKSFNIGVVAFSKDGIDRVEFEVDGQGYSGENPLISNSMTYNSRTNVYEYWVPLRSSGFASNGEFSVIATIYGSDGDTRTLEKIPLIVDATGNLFQHKAWVSSITGNDATGLVNDSSTRFATIAGAANEIQNRNGGKADGAIIYLDEGTYAMGSGSINTFDEWLTIARNADAEKEETILDTGGDLTDTKLIKVDGVTLLSNGSNKLIFSTGFPQNLWIHNSRIIGSGRWIQGSNPINHKGAYYTDTYIYNVDRAVRGGLIARGLEIKQIGEDAFQNFPLVINTTLDDQDPGSTYWHADSYQSWGDGPSNRIIYNFYGTDLHYQGLFMRATQSPGNNNAFVNMFLEMREPGRQGSSGGKTILTNGALYGVWDHLLLWHCTFPTEFFAINADDSGFGFTNSSFIGNVFYEYRDNVTKNGGDPSYAAPENSGNNDFQHNHYIWSCTDQGNCTGSEPHWYSKSPDSDINVSQTVGDPQIDLTDPASTTFGEPLAGSPLVNRLSFSLVPVDVRGNLRDQTPDVGAFEFMTNDSPPVSIPRGFRLLE